MLQLVFATKAMLWFTAISGKRTDFVRKGRRPFVRRTDISRMREMCHIPEKRISRRFIGGGFVLLRFLIIYGNNRKNSRTAPTHSGRIRFDKGKARPYPQFYRIMRL